MACSSSANDSPSLVLDEPSGANTTVQLTEDDIEGASLDISRVNTYTVRALRWWLLCRGIDVPSSWKKAQIIEK